MARTASRTTPNHQYKPPRGVDLERPRPIVVLGDDARSLRRGFTIVELLIVIVVIAILAAISIVAYNGITNRAKSAAAASAAEQAAKKVLAYAAVNSDQFPSALSDAGVSDGSAGYQYRVDNAANPKTFCITATAQNVSYWVSSTSATPAAGACAGHGVNGGATITNLARDPRASAYSNIAGALWWNAGRWFGSGAAGTHSLVASATDGPAGIPTYVRKTWSVAPSSMGASGDTGFNNSNGGVNGIPVVEGDPVSISCYLRPSVQRNFSINVYQYTSTGTAFSAARVYGTEVAGPANVWTRVSQTYSAPSGVAFVMVICDSNATTWGGATNWQVGSTLDGTGLMLTKSPGVYPYADGNSAGWVWNGTPNSSTSTGPTS